MTLSLALATAALLAVQPSNLPPDHPPVPPGTSASPARPSAPGGMPEGHPPMPGSAGVLPEGHPPMPQAGQGATPGGMPQGHPPMSGTGRAPPTAEELLKQLDSTEGLRGREKTFEIASSLGKLYYTNGRPADAVTYFLQAETKAQPTRKLYEEQRKKLGKQAPSSLDPAGCGFSEGMALEARGQLAEERAKKGDTAGAVACARLALEPLLEVEVLRANSLYLTGDTEGALMVYARVLAVAPTNEEALFSRSALLYETKGEDVKAMQTAHEGFEAFVAVHPDSPRTALAQQLSQFAQETVKAGGREKWKQQRAKERGIRLSQPLATRQPMPGTQPTPGTQGAVAAGAGQQDTMPTLTQEMVDAVQNTERTPELEAGLAKLVEEGEEHLARGRFEDALGVYRRVVPFQPENGRAKAGMAWALVGLGRGAMADRVWGVAVSSDPTSVEKLGDTLLAKGDAKGAKAVWAKLLASAPDYPNKTALQAKAGQ